MVFKASHLSGKCLLQVTRLASFLKPGTLKFIQLDAKQFDKEGTSIPVLVKHVINSPCTGCAEAPIMSHPIIEGAVELLKIVTPGAYWIKCDACEGSCRTPTSIKRKPNSNEYYYPQQGDKVFVQDEDRFFYRGTVCGRRLLPGAHGWLYVVQLTDTFQVKDFKQPNVYPTYGESSAACQSAHLVSLYQVLPHTPPTGYGKCVDSAERKAFEKIVANWDRSTAALAHLMQANVNVSFAQSKLINGSIYGEFSTSRPLLSRSHGHCYDLSDYLHFEKLAVKMTFRFEAVVKALMSNPLVDGTKLLPTFDPCGTVTVKPKPALPLKERLEPESPERIDFDFTGFKIHADDVALHKSLISQDYHVNVLYTGAVPKRDTVVRYTCPEGRVVLGTVLNFNIKCATHLADSVGAVGSCLNGQKFHPVFSLTENSDHTEVHYSDEMFEKFPPYYNSGKSRTSIEPGSLLFYDFDETRRNFEAAGGVFKELLLPYPFATAVERSIVRHLDFLGVDSLREWQKLCLPTLSCRKNLVLLGSKSTGKLTTATISALSWMSYVNPPKHGSVHPQLIIFISNFNRAGMVGKLCKQLTDFRVIISTSAFITDKQKEEAKGGCDVLITTPSNWAKLVHENVFNYSRLNSVIFDELDRLHEIYTEEVMQIFNALDFSVSRRVQTVVVSSSWGAMICDRKMQKKLFEFPTVCIMDAILSCLYYNLTPTAVFVDSDNMIGNLDEILSRCVTKRLLLCKDEKEGRSVIEKMSHVGHILFAHENLRTDAALKIAREWDKNDTKVLVCTDDSFKHLDFFKNVGVMISWMTSSWATLCSRFMAFSRVFGSKNGLFWASAYLFCDCKKLEELLLIKHISNKIRCVNGELEEHLSRASIQAEYGKPAHICPSVFMFGKCKDVPLCALRHVFLPEDEARVPVLRLFLNVNILRVRSAFRYSVRVREIVSNYDHDANVASALVSKLYEIENGLAKSYRERCSPNAIEIGQTVGACIVSSEGDLLRRATVNSTPEDGSSDLYSLSIVDFEEPDVLLPHAHLFVLPEEVAKLPKDVIDLYITGLVPADFKSDWQNDTLVYVTNSMIQLKESTYLAGNVTLVTANRSVLVDTLSCFRENDPPQKQTVSVIDSEFFSIKDLILASGFCVKNVTHLPSLAESLIKTPFSPTYRSIYFLNPVGKYGFRTSLPTYSAPAVVSTCVDPGLIYVQLTGEWKKLEYFENSLSSALDCSKRKLQLIALDELCAFQSKGKWNRALVVDIFADLEQPVGSVHILLVDYGHSLCVQPDKLYCLPSSDYVFVPFFALQCELTGIKPFRDGNWHEKATEELRSYVRNSHDELENLTVHFCETKNIDESSCYPCRYSVVLWHPNDQHYSINYNLARKGFVGFDPATKNVLSKPVTNGHNYYIDERFHERSGQTSAT